VGPLSASGSPGGFVPEWQLDILQCGLSIIGVTRQRRVLVSFNDTGHLPQKMQTFL
jgi:hypothetical protein